jgi:hypothetical protein
MKTDVYLNRNRRVEILSFSNYETKTEYINGSKTCVYCGNQELVIDDSFSEHGEYQGTRNYCECEQAQIEQKMKREMEKFENKKKEIEKQYQDKLKHNEKAIVRAKFEGIIKDALTKYVMYGILYGMTREEFLELSGKLFDRHVWHDEE